MKRRTIWKHVAEELAWTLERINCANHDRNQNRQAQISLALAYGLHLMVQARSNEPLPKRPDIDSAI